MNLKRYWSETPVDVGDATLVAFGLDPLEALEAPETPSKAPRPKRPPRPSTGPGRRSAVREDLREETLASRLGSPWSRIFDELSAWEGNQQDLRAAATNNLKKLVHKSVRKSLDSSVLPINLDEDRFNHERDVRIEGTVTLQSQGDPIIVIERDAGTAAALQGMILLDQLPDVDSYAGADTYRRHAAHCLEEWTTRVTERLEQSPESTATQAVAGLLVCAAVRGAYEEATDPHDYLAALFGGVSSAPGEHRSSRWRDVVESASVNYRRLRPIVEARFGEARGTGGTRAVRADQILAVIREFTDSWRLESDDPAVYRFMRSVTPAVEAEWEALCHEATGAARFVDAESLVV